jgi:hypothetical protein
VLGRKGGDPRHKACGRPVLLTAAATTSRRFKLGMWRGSTHGLPHDRQRRVRHTRRGRCASLNVIAEEIELRRLSGRARVGR